MVMRFWISELVVLSILGASLIASPAVAASSTTGTIVPTHLAYPSGGTNAIGAGIDSSNQNAQLAESVPATVLPSWHNAPPICPSSAGTSASTISVSGALTIVDEVGYQCSSVSAYSTVSGTLKWRRTYHFARSTTVSGGVAYTLHDDPVTSQYFLDAVDISTGVVKWSKWQGQPSGWAESVGSGLVINGMNALFASSGAPAFTAPTGTVSTPGGTSLIAGGTIYYNSSQAVQAFSPAGKLLWTRAKRNSVLDPGAGTATPALHGGLLYIRSVEQVSSGSTLVLNASTGALVRTIIRSDTNISFDGNVGFVSSSDSVAATPTKISAVNLTTGAIYWTHLLPMNEAVPFVITTAPIVEDGLIWINQAADTMSAAEFVALGEVTGTIKSDTIAPCHMAEGNFVVAQHRIFASSDCGTRTYVPSATAPVVTPTPGELLSDPGFESGTGGWTALGAGTITQTSSLTHGGAKSIAVTPTSSTVGTVGFTQNSLITKGVRLAWYRASCWIRPSQPGMMVGMQFTEYSPGAVPKTLPTGSGVPTLAVGTWTYMSTTGLVQTSGDTLAPQVDAVNASTSHGTLYLDDCSVTKP